MIKVIDCIEVLISAIYLHVEINTRLLTD